MQLDGAGQGLEIKNLCWAIFRGFKFPRTYYSFLVFCSEIWNKRSTK